MLVAHLEAKGHQVKNSPNAKLSRAQYEVLLKEFASQKTFKEKALERNRKSKEEIRSVMTNKKAPPLPPMSEEEVGEEILSAKQLKIEISKDETPQDNQEEGKAKELEQPSALQKEPASEEKETLNIVSFKPKVVGKVDLSQFKQKSKKEVTPENKKKEEKAVAPVTENVQPKVESKVVVPTTKEPIVEETKKAVIETPSQEPPQKEVVPSIEEKESKNVTKEKAVLETKEKVSSKKPADIKVENVEESKKTQPPFETDLSALKEEILAEKVVKPVKEEVVQPKEEKKVVETPVKKESKKVVSDTTQSNVVKEKKEVVKDTPRPLVKETEEKPLSKKKEESVLSKEKVDTPVSKDEKNVSEKKTTPQKEQAKLEKEAEKVKEIPVLDPPKEEKPKVKAKENPKVEKEERSRSRKRRRTERPKHKVSVSEKVNRPNREDTVKNKEQVEGEEETVIRASDHTPKLSGLKVMGKIELPSSRKKKSDKKKDRKRKEDDKRDRKTTDRKTTNDNKRSNKRTPVTKDNKTPVKDGQKSATTDNQSAESEDGKKKRRRRRRRKRKAGETTTTSTGVNTNAKTTTNNSSNTNKSKTTNNKTRKVSSTPSRKPSDKEIKSSIRSTMATLNKGASRTRQRLRRAKRNAEAKKRMQRELREEKEARILKVTEFITANEFASMLNAPVNGLITKCFMLGMMVSINQRLDAEIMTILAEEYGYKLEFIDVTDEEFEVIEEDDSPEDLLERNPIITVMGHVDHGKTTLLDFLRKTNVTSQEAGGITQHIGAYEVQLKSGRKVTFLDTPGHEAFTAMRARGAKVTDVVIIVVAADDNVMPQTKEAINHAQAAGVPIVFAINKIDKANASPDNIKRQLAEMNYLVEDWGGKYQSQEISAKFGTNVDDLLEKVILEADLLELKANPNRLASGTVIESKLEKGRGMVATVLVQRGTLRIGDVMVAGIHFGKVRALINQAGQRVKEAGPAMPVQMLGLHGQPQAGDKFQSFDEESKAKSIAQKRHEVFREQQFRQTKRLTLEEIGRRKAIGNFKELKLIIKGDVDGSVEALSGSLLKLSTEEVQVAILMKGVGGITESDVLLASASDAVIIAFNVRPKGKARLLATKEGVDIRTYSVIYDAINDVRDALEGLLSPDVKEEIVGNVEVRNVFKISKVGTVAGCYVTSGRVQKNATVRLIRDSVVIYDSTIESLRRFKEDAKEVSSGFECGIMVKNFPDIKVGDVIEVYKEVEVKRTLKK